MSQNKPNDEQKLRCCVTKQTQPATFEDKNATPSATQTQPMSLKALAEAALERNTERNKNATVANNIRNFCPENAPQKLRSELPMLRPLEYLENAAAEDWEELKDNPEALRVFDHILTIRKMREQGKIPSHYTQISECQSCGKIPIWQGAPSQLLACPWCFNREGNKPMPEVTA